MTKTLKKLTIALAVLFMLCAVMSAFGFSDASATEIDNSDSIFLSQVTDEVGESLAYDKSPLYNKNGNHNGWMYDFTSDAGNGYALLTKIEVNGEKTYETAEIKFSETTPFDGSEGKPVYITRGKYLDLRGSTLFDLANGEAVTPSKAAEYLKDGFVYGSEDGHIIRNENIRYASKATTAEYSITHDLPKYAGDIGSSSCAGVSGGVSIAYYDQFKEELIPDYTVYRKFGPSFTYKPLATQTRAMLTTLGQLMGSNLGGTSYAGFQMGMNNYISGRGFQYVNENMFSLFSFDFNKVKSAVEAGKTVSIFLDEYAIVKSISSSAGTDSIANYFSTTNHVVTVCGYRVDTYYDAAGNVLDTRTYLKANVGLEVGTTIEYLNINGLSKIDYAISIDIR